MDEYFDQFAEDHINGGYGDILDQLNAEAEYADEYPDIDEPWEFILERQELVDGEMAVCTWRLEWLSGRLCQC